MKKQCYNCNEWNTSGGWCSVAKDVKKHDDTCNRFYTRFTVKELEWVSKPYYETKDQYVANTVTKTGYKIDVYKKDGRIDAYQTLGNRRWHSFGDFKTIEEAKQVAQEHYENLIMGCLE